MRKGYKPLEIGRNHRESPDLPRGCEAILYVCGAIFNLLSGVTLADNQDTQKNVRYLCISTLSLLLPIRSLRILLLGV